MCAKHWFDSADFFVSEHFLDDVTCQRFATQAAQERSIKTGVVKLNGGSSYQDEEARRTKYIFLPERMEAAISYRLMSLKPQLEEYFQMELLGCHAPQLLAYHPGDFFQRHRDQVLEADKFTLIRNLTTVIFLNQAGSDYQGGELRLYDVNADWPAEGVVFPAARGHLLAFRPELYHEVLPVTDGIRYTLINWFY